MCLCIAEPILWKADSFFLWIVSDLHDLALANQARAWERSLWLRKHLQGKSVIDLSHLRQYGLRQFHVLTPIISSGVYFGWFVCVNCIYTLQA